VVAVGEPAPEFTGQTDRGASLSLASMRGRPVILFFFPKANSPGCTMETRAFADHHAELQSAGFQLVGVSVDSVSAQRQFASKCSVDFPLIADVDKSIARSYGVLGFLGFARRVTFFIGPDGKVQDVVSAIGPSSHIERARALAGQTGPRRPPTPERD
jgi:thioredoxin-dependent peroxiredoxin